MTNLKMFRNQSEYINIYLFLLCLVERTVHFLHFCSKFKLTENSLIVFTVHLVAHEHEVTIVRDDWTSWRKHRESQEHECTDQDGPVRTILPEAHDHLSTFQHVLSVLQKSNKAFFGTVRQNAIWNLHIEDTIT